MNRFIRRLYHNISIRKTGLLCLLAGLLLPFAFAPAGLGLLAMLLLAWLFYAWFDAGPREAFRYGFLFGLGQFTAGVYWIYHSLHVFGHIPSPLSMLLVVVLAAGLALYPAITGYLANRFSVAASPLRLLLIYPAIWLLFEWLRGILLTGFPWLNLGATQTDTWLAGWLPLAGEYGVSLLVGLSAAALVWLLLCYSREHIRSVSGLAIAVVLLLSVWLSGLGLQQQDWTEPRGSLSVTLVQGNTPQEIKWSPSARDGILDTYLGLSKDAWKRDLIIWPETAIPAYPEDVHAFVQDLDTRAKQSGTDVLTGIPIYNQGRYYNAIVSLGSKIAFYYKRHLVPFGEYIPLRSAFGSMLDLLQVPMSDFSTGKLDQPPLTVAGYPVGLGICYEIAFSSVVRAQLPQAGLLVNLSNNAWFGDSIAPHQILQLARVRAMEAGRAVLSSTNNGITAAVDHKGRVIAQAPQFVETVLDAEIEVQGGATPFVLWGEWPALGLALLMLLAGVILPRLTRV